MLARMAGQAQPSLPFGEGPESARRSARLVSIQELAAYLDVPVKTIYAWRTHGEGPRGFRIGRHVRFRWPDVEAWVSEQIAAERRSRRI